MVGQTENHHIRSRNLLQSAPDTSKKASLFSHCRHLLYLLSFTVVVLDVSYGSKISVPQHHTAFTSGRTRYVIPGTSHILIFLKLLSLLKRMSCVFVAGQCSPHLLNEQIR